MLYDYFQRQLDYTNEDCVVPAALNQGFDTLQPEADIGLIILSATAPNVVSYPALARFLWAQTLAGIPNGAYYYYGPAGWTLLNLEDGARLLPQTVALSALSAAGGTPGDIIQVASAGGYFVFTSLASAFTNGTLDPLKLIPGAEGQILTVQGGVAAWVTFDSTALIAKIANNTLPVTKLLPGAGKQLLRTNAGATAAEWVDVLSVLEDNSVPVNKLAPGTTNANKLVGVNADGTLVTYVTPAYSRVQVSLTGPWLPPTVGNYVEADYGFVSYPTTFDAFFQCKTVNNGFAVGDRISYKEITTGGSNDEAPAYLLTCVLASKKLRLVQFSDGAVTQRNFMNSSTGARIAFDAAQWDLYFQATLIS